MRTVAEAAGVATSTVSKALRGDPSIPEKRRAQIREIADKLGYRPHPMVSALMAQLHAGRRRSDPHCIAWVDLWTKNRKSVEKKPDPLLDGARERAKVLGYNIEVHYVLAEGISPARLRQILLARSQWALILPPSAESTMAYPIDMEGFAGVTIGTSVREPVLHRVSHNHHVGCRVACAKLREKGFRRIGFAMSPWMDQRMDVRWKAAYLASQLDWPEEDRLPPLIVGEDQEDAYRAWKDKHRPDVVIMADTYVAAWEKTVRRGERPLRTVWLVVDGLRRGIWGIDYRSDLLGAAAVEMVIGQIHRHERGSPPVPHTLLIDGAWFEG